MMRRRRSAAGLSKKRNADATSSADDPGRMDIALEYRLRHTLQRDLLHISVDLQAEGS